MKRIWLIAASAVLATACGPKVPADTPTPPPPEKPKAAKEEAPAEIDPDYVYSPVGKRDPFRPALGLARPGESSDPSCGPLCNWELEQLRVAAVVWGTASPVAMVEDPLNRGHVVRRGSFIGKHNGRVTEILRDRLVVTEMQRVGPGHLVPVTTELQLRARPSIREEEPVNLMVGAEDEVE